MSDGLDSLRDVASALKRWRPPSQWKLRLAREAIEQLVGPAPWWTQGRRPGRWPSDPAKASDEGKKQHPVPPDPGHREPGAGRGMVPIAKSARRGVRMVVPASSGDQGRKAEKGLRKLERWFPELRWLFRRLHRLALAGRPGLLRARRALVQHRRKLIWGFVIGVSWVMPSS